jgi:HNH endonuclease
MILFSCYRCDQQSEWAGSKKTFARWVHHFCSRSCRSLYYSQQKSIQAKCSHCHKRIIKVKSKWAGIKFHFCGRACHGLYQTAHAIGHITPQGYLAVGHKGKVIRIHRAIVEKRIGRKLKPTETIHHKNGVRADNRSRNLELRVSYHGEGQRPVDLIRWLKRDYPLEFAKVAFKSIDEVSA